MTKTENDVHLPQLTAKNKQTKTRNKNKNSCCFFLLPPLFFSFPDFLGFFIAVLRFAFWAFR
jgi:hypothetical protein